MLLLHRPGPGEPREKKRKKRPPGASCFKAPTSGFTDPGSWPARGRKGESAFLSDQSDAEGRGRHYKRRLRKGPEKKGKKTQRRRRKKKRVGTLLIIIRGGRKKAAIGFGALRRKREGKKEEAICDHSGCRLRQKPGKEKGAVRRKKKNVGSAGPGTGKKKKGREVSLQRVKAVKSATS